MLKSDRHNKNFDPTQRSTPVTLSDFSGGLNLVDNPANINEKTLMTADNFQLSPTRSAIETRAGLIGHTKSIYSELDGTYDPPLNSTVSFMAPVNGIIYIQAGGYLYATAGKLTELTLGLHRCSDFTWMKYGPYRCDQIEFKCSEFIEQVP